MSGLNMSIIKAMPVVLPALAKQERYVAVVREIQNQKFHQLRHLRQLADLFDSLQARAFHQEL
jgi:type I restriction enzyme S subunit